MAADPSPAALEPATGDPAPWQLQPQLREPPFVGRQREMEWLQSAWQRAVNGHGAVVVVAGEPGAGKTRLAEELAVAALASRGWVLFASCDVAAPSPYRPLLAALRRARPAIPTELMCWRGGGGDTKDIFGLLDQPRAPAPAPAPANKAHGRDHDSQAPRRRVLEALTELVDGLSRTAPVLLVLDDLEHADRSTLVVLRHVAHRVRTMPLLVFATYCDTAVSRAEPLYQVLEEMRGEPYYERRILSGLDRRAVAALAGDETQAARLWSASEGNPLCLHHHLRLLTSAGAGAPSLHLPVGIHAVIDHRLSALTPGTRKVLAAAAVVGPEFHRYEVSFTSRVRPERVEHAFVQGEAAGIISSIPPRPRHYRFTHALFRQALYNGIPSNQRVRLHGQVAEALRRMPSPGSDHLALLAFHFGRSSPVGRSDSVVRHATRAGDHAMSVGGYEDAAGYYGRALAATGVTGSERTRAGILVSLADAHWRAGDHLRARTAALEAAHAARSVRDGERLAHAALALTRVAPVWGRDHVIIRLLEESLSLLDGKSSLRAPVETQLDQLRRLP